MTVHKPPANDIERLDNLLAGCCSPDDDAFDDEEMDAAAAAAGIDYAAWGEEIRAKARAHLDAAARPPEPLPELSDHETLLRAEVDRAVARYQGKVPPFMLAKLRELAERYWREHPQASHVLRRMAAERSPAISEKVPTELGKALAEREAESREGGRKT